MNQWKKFSAVKVPNSPVKSRQSRNVRNVGMWQSHFVTCCVLRRMRACKDLWPHMACNVLRVL